MSEEGLVPPNSMAGLIPEKEGTDAGQAPGTGERGREIAPAASLAINDACSSRPGTLKH